MRAIMADNDIHGQMSVLVRGLQSEGWRELWLSLNLAVRTFADLSLDPGIPDAELWHSCQREQIALITGNRNKESADSLEATIQSCNLPTSLPVFTLSDPNQILHSREYANKVVEKLLEYLLEIDNVRGIGRVWLP